MKKRPGYWTVFHKSNSYDIKSMLKLIARVVEETGSPWRVSHRGRKPKFHPKEHAALIITMRYFEFSYRQMEGMAEAIVGKPIDHSTVGWAMKRLPEGYLHRIITVLHKHIEHECKDGIYIVDSTGIVTDRYQRMSMALKNVQKKRYLKLHVLVRYFGEEGVISIRYAKATYGSKHDAPVLGEFLKHSRLKPGVLLGDRAYDSKENIELAYKKGLTPMLKQRRWDKRRGIRKRHSRDFNEEMYKQFRGMVESVFGGMETAYGNRTRCRLRHTQTVSILLMAVVFNVKSVLRMRATLGRDEILCLYGFIRQLRFFIVNFLLQSFLSPPVMT